MSQLTIVVVTYNSQAWIGRCLGSLPAALAGVTAEVVVVDNSSSDGTVALVGTEHPDARLIARDSNSGFAVAVNEGVRAGTAPWVLLVNPDMECHPGSIRALLDFAEQHDQYGLFGGRMVTEDGSLEPSSAWDLPTVWSLGCFATGLSTAFPKSRLFNPESLGTWQRDTVREVGMVSGAFLLTRRSLWEALGGLDETYFMYGEDADFAARARRMGRPAVIVPDAVAMHAVGKSSTGHNKLPVLLAGRITYAQRNFGPAGATVAVNLLRAGTGLRALGYRVTGRGEKWHFAWTQRQRWWQGFAPADQSAGGRRGGASGS